MASAKTTHSYLHDLRIGNAKKREAAVRELAVSDPAGARAVLLELLDETKKLATRRVLERCLHHVADLGAARGLLADPRTIIEPAHFTPLVLGMLYDDLRIALPSLASAELGERLERLQVLELRRPAGGAPAAFDDWSERLTALLFAILDDARFRTFHARASRGILDLGTRAGSTGLLQRWEAYLTSTSTSTADTTASNALEATIAWAQLGCPAERADGTARVPLLIDALVAELGHPSSPPGPAAFDDLLASTASHVPASRVIPLTLAVARAGDLPRTAAALAKRLVGVANGTTTLVALLDDPALAASHLAAAEALLEGGLLEARAVLTHGEHLPGRVLSAALAKLTPVEIFDFAAPRIDDGTWYDAVVESKTGLRDPRWLDRALLDRLSALGDRGRRLLVAVARDLRNESRRRAVAELARASERASDRMEKRHVLHALGQTGHPDATPALVAALDHPDIADAAPLVCTALGDCGDTRAIAGLSARSSGRYKPFIDAAINAIRSRVARIHETVLLAAVDDDDPKIAALARAARDGDLESAMVLEDALLELGRL